MKEVVRAFETIEQRMERFERMSVSRSQQGARARVQSTKQETNQRERDYHKLVVQTERWERESAREAGKAAKERERSAEKANAAEIRMAQRAAKEQEKLSREGVREREKAARDRERIAQNEARTEERIYRQSLHDRARAARQAEADVERQQAAGRARRAQYARAFGGAVTGGVGRVVGGALALGGAAFAIGGGFSVADSLRNEMAFKREVVQASNAAFVEGDPTRTREAASPAKIEALARHVQSTTNFDKTDLAAAIHEYVGNASDFAGISATNKSTGRSNLEEFAMMAKGSGGDLGQIIRAAAAMKANLPSATPDDLLANMRAIIGGGKKGNLPLEQLAAHVGTITSTASFFGGDVRMNQEKLLGLAQLVGPATGGDAAETATSIKHFASDVMRHGEKNGMSKKDIYVGGDPAKGLLDPADLMANVFRVTKGRPDLAQKILGERSIKAFAALKTTYDEGEANAKGTGSASVLRKVLDFEKSSYNQENVDKDFGAVMATDTERLQKEMNHLTEVIAFKGTPIFERWIDALARNPEKIEKFVDEIAKAVDWLATNPWKGLGLAVTASVVQSLASAGIGVAVQHALLALLAGGAAPGAAAGGAGAAAAGAGGAGALARGASAVAAPLAAGVLAVMTGKDIIERGKGAAYAGEDQAQKDLTSLRVLRRDLEQGKGDPQALSARVQEIQGRLATARDKSGVGAAIEAGAGALSFVPGQRKAVDSYNEAAQYAGHAEEFAKALQRATQVLNQFSGGISSTTSGGTVDAHASRYLPPNQQRPGPDHG